MQSGSLFVLNVNVLLITMLSCGLANSVCSNNQAVGVNDSAIIPDNCMTASDWYRIPSKARLNASTAWSTKPKKQGVYLQIDLRTEHVICGVATQGGQYGWVKEFKLRFSTNRSLWVYYKEGEKHKIFKGNSNANSIKKNMLQNPVSARYIRFVPTKEEDYITMRVEVYVSSQGRSSSSNSSGSKLKMPCSEPIFIPQITSARAMSPDCIYIEWEIKTDRPIDVRYETSYIITYTPQGGKSLTAEKSSEKFALITNLQTYTNYTITVTVIKDGKARGTSTAKTVQTLNNNASVCAPRLRFVTATSSTSINVTWTLPLNIRCKNDYLRGYKVAYKLNRYGSTMNYLNVKDHLSTTTVVTGLDKYTEYNFQVLAYTFEDGPMSNNLTGKTKEDAPECFPNLKSAAPISSTSIRVIWTPLPNTKCRNGVLRGYKVAYKLNGPGSTMKYLDVKGGHATTTVVTGLDKYTQYFFQVLAYTVKDGPPSRTLANKTEEDVPDGYPQQVTFSKINVTSYRVTWGLVPKHLANGNITNYEVKCELVRKGKNAVQNNQRTFSVANDVLQYDLHGLELCAAYHVSVKAYTGKGPGPYSHPVTVITQRPGPPESLVFHKFSTTARLHWDKPPGASNIKYKIEYKGSKSYWPHFEDIKILTSSKTSILLNDLVPGTRYNFWVYTTTICGASAKVFTTKTTDVEAPIAVDVATVKYHNDTDTAVNVTLWKARQRNGPISFYQVVILRGTNNLALNYSKALYNYTTALHKRLSYYITAEIDADWLEHDSVFTIGDGSIYQHMYSNVALERGQQYLIYQRAVTCYQQKTFIGEEALVAVIRVAVDNPVPKSENTKSNESVVAIGTVFGVIIALCIVGGAGLFYWRRHGKYEKHLHLQELPSERAQERNGSPEAVKQMKRNESMASQSTSISVEQFPAYIASVKVNDFASLKNEYRNVPHQNHLSSSTVSKKPANKHKNRYGNIAAYDHSRVVIGKFNEDENSDYINASFIHDCSQRPKAYIATQGPLTETFDAFWKMIWEQNVKSIVMLTNLIELRKIKCHQYWPDDCAQYADIKVKNEKTEVFPDCIIRTMSLIKDDKSRKVVQFHCTVWPDHGVPQHTTSILSFRRKVRAETRENDAPTVVHCSAGIGRTGAYIMIDSLLEQADKENCVDILSCIHSLRKDRPSMVQTKEQYIFVHMVLYDAIVCGYTEIQVNDLRIATQKLAAVDPIEKASGYSLEFKRLSMILSQEIESDSDIGRTETNTKKNRYPDIVPINKHRVVLKTELEGEEDYVNASFIHSYRDRNAFIVTQAPLQNTVVDFWKMVMDYDIGTIVMLNNLEEGDETFVQYWPGKDCGKYGNIEVVFLESEEYAGFVLRKFKVTRRQSSRTIEHFQHISWIDKCVPDNPHSILQLFEQIQRSQHRSGKAPILIQCSNGTGRSGTFCAIVSTLERVKQEQVLDVFQTVKLIRSNRPGAVQTLTQYVFCYQIVQKYLDSFSDYANFKD